MTKERSDNLKEEAKRAFKNHQISKRSEGRWYLQRPYEDGKGWDCVYAAEVISLERGALFVGGDIDYVIFAYYSDTPSHTDKVFWMGNHNDLDSYVAQKAAIGTGQALVEEFDEEEAESFIRDQLELYEQEYPSEHGKDVARQLKEFVENIPRTQEEFIHELYNIDVDLACDVGNAGMVTHPRVYYAHAALQRLCTLLREEDTQGDETSTPSAG